MNGSHGLRFRLFSFPVQVDVSFLIMAAILGARAGDAMLVLIWIGAVFVSVLLHELGHALTGRAFGLAPAIRLYSMGGLTYWGSGRETAPWQNILISLSGPFAGFIAGAAVIVARLAMPASESVYLRALVWDLLWVNIGWGVLNLLPILPLDGGHVVQSLGRLIFGPPGDTIARVVSIVTALTALAVAIVLKYYWGAILAGYFALTNIAATSSRREE